MSANEARAERVRAMDGEEQSDEQEVLRVCGICA